MLSRLTEALQAALPAVLGVSLVRAGYVPIGPATDAGARGDRRLVVQWGRSPTEAEEASARAVVAAFNFAPRRPKGRLALAAEVAALAVADRNKLVALMVADWIRENPARGAAVGIVGDEEVS